MVACQFSAVFLKRKGVCLSVYLFLAGNVIIYRRPFDRSKECDKRIIKVALNILFRRRKQVRQLISVEYCYAFVQRAFVVVVALHADIHRVSGKLPVDCVCFPRRGSGCFGEAYLQRFSGKSADTERGNV